MKIDTKVLEWESADLDALAELVWEARMASPLWSEGQSVQSFREYIENSISRWPDSFPICAYQDRELVGWLALIKDDPQTFELWRWHPFIKPCEDQEHIADQLLRAVKRITAGRGAQSLEVCCHLQKEHLNPEVESYLETQKSWYEKNGLKKIGEDVYLTSPVGQITLSTKTGIQEPYSIAAYDSKYLSDMYICFLEAFSGSADRTYQNKSTDQRKAMFYGYLENGLNCKASRVLLEGDFAKGFTLVQTRERVNDEHLALIAVAPECQNRGWGRKLLSASVRAAELNADEIFSIGVDLSNQIAYSLYASMGFKAQTKLITHIWKNMK